MSIHEPISNQRTSAPAGGVALSCAVLLGVMLLPLAGMAAWNNAAYGWTGVLSAGAAWLLCTSAALAALLVSARFAATPYAMAASLGTMLIRMGVPLAGLLVLPRMLPELAAAGLGTSVLVCYLVALAAETALALRHVAPGSAGFLKQASQRTVEA